MWVFNKESIMKEQGEWLYSKRFVGFAMWNETEATMDVERENVFYLVLFHNTNLFSDIAK